jgi:hypothetical protein
VKKCVFEEERSDESYTAHVEDSVSRKKYMDAVAMELE